MDCPDDDGRARRGVNLPDLPEPPSRSLDRPTLLLLFTFMVVSAQVRLGGFYTAVTQKVGGLPLSRAGGCWRCLGGGGWGRPYVNRLN